MRSIMANYYITIDLITRTLKQFIKNSKGKTCQFYVGISKDKDDTIKFGITCGRLNDRKKNCNLRTIHCIYEGNALKVAMLEAVIKLHFCDHNEFRDYSDLHKIFEFVRIWRQ